MATSKSLKPTNQTISIPAMSDSPDMSVPADAISKSADAINNLMIMLSSSDDTWAEVWAKLNVLISGGSATIYAHGNALSVITASALTSMMFGTVTRVSTGEFHFMLKDASNVVHAVSLTNATSSSAGTCAWKRLNSGKSVSQNDDMNDYTVPGKYYSASSAVSTTLSNAPLTGAGFTLTVNNRGANVDQIAQSSDSIMIRGKISSGWSDWKSLATITENIFTPSSSNVKDNPNVISGRVGRIVTISFGVGIKTAPSGWLAIGTVSAKPSDYVYGQLYKYSNTGIIGSYPMRITSAGTVQVIGNFTVDDNLYGNITYFA